MPEQCYSTVVTLSVYDATETSTFLELYLSMNNMDSGPVPPELQVSACLIAITCVSEAGSLEAFRHLEPVCWWPSICTYVSYFFRRFVP